MENLTLLAPGSGQLILLVLWSGREKSRLKHWSGAELVSGIWDVVLQKNWQLPFFVRRHHCDHEAKKEEVDRWSRNRLSNHS